LAKDFEILDHTADIAVRAFGQSQAEAYVNAARAMFSQISDLASIQPRLVREVEAEAPDCESLLVAWLNELIYLFDTEQLIFKRFEISSISDTKLAARAWGERVDPHCHEIKVGIKSATYHRLKVERTPAWQVEFVLDI
jgi:SHS2 domain-containing protein